VTRRGRRPAPSHPTGTMKRAFTYFGSKERVAPDVWERLGDVDCYIEPLCGSSAVLLARPDWHNSREELINDKDEFLTNFYRAAVWNPEAVARWLDWPLNQRDYLSRHRWLRAKAAGLRARLHADPNWYDAKVAGWWVYGQNLSIGEGWKRPHLTSRPHVGRRRGIQCEADPLSYLQRLAARLRHVRILNTSWQRAVKTCLTGELGRSPDATVGLFFDAPYKGYESHYRHPQKGVADEVARWAAFYGENPRFRIAVCGYAGDHEFRRGWEEFPWVGAQGKLRHLERVWFSPFCLPGKGSVLICS
jgi:DNA adenine methylase